MIPISERLLAVTTPAEFSKAVDFEFQSMGFAIWSAIIVGNLQLDGKARWIGHCAMPASWLALPNGFFDGGGSGQCPVMWHLQFNSSPLIWLQEDYYGADQHDLYDLQASHGANFECTNVTHAVAKAMRLGLT